MNTTLDDAEKFVKPGAPEPPEDGYLDETATMDLEEVASVIRGAEGAEEGQKEKTESEEKAESEEKTQSASNPQSRNEEGAEESGEDAVSDEKVSAAPDADAVSDEEASAAPDADNVSADDLKDGLEEGSEVTHESKGGEHPGSAEETGPGEEPESIGYGTAAAEAAAEEALEELRQPKENGGSGTAAGKRKKQKEKNSFFRRHRVLSILLIVFLVFDGVVGAGYGYFHSKYILMQISAGEVTNPTEMSAKEESENAKQNEALKKQTEGIADAESIAAEGDIFSDSDVYNILLIGSDDRTKKFSDNARGDTCILLSINKEKKQVHLVSFERACGMPILAGEYEGQYDWLTHTFRYGGASLMTREIRECFKVDVTKYIRVNIWTFIQLVDSVGGVDIDMTEAEVDNINHPEGTYTEGYIKGMHVENEVQQDLTPGMNHLNGATAMCYARLRSIDSDWYRVQRQRKVILSAVDQLKKLSVTQLDQLLNNVLPMVQTNLTESDCAELISLVPEYLNADFDDFTMPFKNTYGMMTGMEGRSMFAVDFDTCSKILQSVLYDGADSEKLQEYYEGLSEPTYYSSSSYKAAQSSSSGTAASSSYSSQQAGSSTAAGTSDSSGQTGTADSAGTADSSGIQTSGQSGIPAGAQVDPNTGYYYDPNTGIVYDPNTGAVVGTVPDSSVLNQGGAAADGTGSSAQTQTGGTAGSAASGQSSTGTGTAQGQTSGTGTDATGTTDSSQTQAASGTADQQSSPAAGQ